MTACVKGSRLYHYQAESHFTSYHYQLALLLLYHVIVVSQFLLRQAEVKGLISLTNLEIHSVITNIVKITVK